MCTANYRWDNDWLICNQCGQKLGYKYEIPDYGYQYNSDDGTIICKDKESKTVISLFYPYNKYIKKEDIKF